MAEFDLKSSTIDKGLDLIKGFLERAFGPSIDEFGLMRQDNMKFRRAKNQLKVFQQAKELAEAGEIEIKQMNLKALFPLLEGIALEEDETLQDMWATLLVNYIDANKNLTINVYPTILQQLSSNEVKILEYMYLNHDKLYSRYSFQKNKEITFTDAEIANLIRLGIIEEVPNISQYGGDFDERNGQYKWDYEFFQPDEYRISVFGSEFLMACK
jgi:hypothetical protein